MDNYYQFNCSKNPHKDGGYNSILIQAFSLPEAKSKARTKEPHCKHSIWMLPNKTNPLIRLLNV